MLFSKPKEWKAQPAVQYVHRALPLCLESKAYPTGGFTGILRPGIPLPTGNVGVSDLVVFGIAADLLGYVHHYVGPQHSLRADIGVLGF